MTHSLNTTVCVVLAVVAAVCIDIQGQLQHSASTTSITTSTSRHAHVHVDVGETKTIPTAPVWPEAFNVSFTTNNGTVKGMLYYDYSQRAQRIDHESGNYECVHFYNTSGACSLVFTATDMYAIIHDSGLCCHDLNVGTVSPSWAANATFLGVDTIQGRSCNHWQKTHQFWSEVDSGLPCEFGFPGKSNGTQNFWFDLDTWYAGFQEPAHFQLSAQCKEPCPFDKTHH
jgi:hypothetical protein